MKSKYKRFWEADMNGELVGHSNAGTFAKVSELPEGRKAVSTK